MTRFRDYRLIHALMRRRRRRGGFVPTDIDGCELWLRADLGVTIAGSGVSVWADQSDNGNDFTQGTDASRPSQSTALGFDSILFGSNDYLSHTGAISAAAAGEWFHVQNLASDPMANNVVAFGFGSSAGSCHIPYSNGVIYDDFAGTVRHTTGSSGGALAGTHIYNARSAAGAWSNYIDGTLHYSTGTNTVGWGTGLKTLGSTSPGSSIVGHLCEVVVFGRSTVLTSDERTALMGYLTGRYS